MEHGLHDEGLAGRGARRRPRRQATRERIVKAAAALRSGDVHGPVCRGQRWMDVLTGPDVLQRDVGPTPVGEVRVDAGSRALRRPGPGGEPLDQPLGHHHLLNPAVPCAGQAVASQIGDRGRRHCHLLRIEAGQAGSHGGGEDSGPMLEARRQHIADPPRLLCAELEEQFLGTVEHRGCVPVLPARSAGTVRRAIEQADDHVVGHCGEGPQRGVVEMRGVTLPVAEVRLDSPLCPFTPGGPIRSPQARTHQAQR